MSIAAPDRPLRPGMAATARTLLSSALVKVSDVTCTAPCSGRGRERSDASSSLTLIRRGVHAYHARRREALAEPGLVLLYRGGEAYALSHPFERSEPDRSTCIEFGMELLHEAFGGRELAGDLGTHLRPATQIAHLHAIAALTAPDRDRLAGEERIVGLLAEVAADFSLARKDAAMPASMRRRVERARAMIASAPSADHGLEAIAAAAATSPFHLARLFRRQTGMTIRGYRLRLRLATALHHLAEGAGDLTDLALSTGFADHSHMTASFRRIFGQAPSALRELLGTSGLARKSKFLQATAGGPG